MEWMWIRHRLRLSEWHLDAATSASALEIVRRHLQRAQEHYGAAMSALEHAALSSEEQCQLREQLHVLSVRLAAIEHGTR